MKRLPIDLPVPHELIHSHIPAPADTGHEIGRGLRYPTTQSFLDLLINFLDLIVISLHHRFLSVLIQPLIYRIQIPLLILERHVRDIEILDGRLEYMIYLLSDRLIPVISYYVVTGLHLKASIG